MIIEIYIEHVNTDAHGYHRGQYTAIINNYSRLCDSSARIDNFLLKLIFIY